MQTQKKVNKLCIISLTLEKGKYFKSREWQAGRTDMARKVNQSQCGFCPRYNKT